MSLTEPHTKLSTLDNNTETVKWIESMAWPTIETTSILLEDQRIIRAKFNLPPELNKNDGIKYPLIVHVG